MMPKLTVTMKIASASCNQTGRDWPTNLKNICDAIDQAIEDQADLLCFEELTLTGYDCGDDFQYSDNTVTQQHLNWIASYAASKNPNLVLSIGHPWRFSDKTITGPERRNNPIFNRLNLPFNVQSFLSGGRILAMSAKRYLYSYERGYESRYFAQWSETAANQYINGREGTIQIELPAMDYTVGDQDIHIDAQTIPFGAPVIKIGGVNATHAICEELWVGSKYDESETDADYITDNPVAGQLRHFDINLVISPNASPSAEDKIDKIRHLVKLNSSLSHSDASEKAIVTVYTDGLGCSGSTIAQAGTRLMAKGGQIISEAPRWSFKPIAYTSQVVDVSLAEPSLSEVHAKIEHEFLEEHTPGVNNAPAHWEHASELEERTASTEQEQLLKTRRFNDELRSELVWMFDYLRKNKLQGFTQALSGGADSAYNAAKVRLMTEMVIKECGLAFLLKELRYSAEEHARVLSLPDDESRLDAVMEKMLTCVYLGTPNNSEETKRAAETLVKGGTREDGTSYKGIGGQFYFYNIQPVVDQLALLYTGVDFDEVPAESVSDVLTRARSFLGITNKEQLQEQSEAFKHHLATLTKHEDEYTGPVLTPANPSHGVTIENLQARVRQVIIMMITNFEPLKVGIANPNLDEICNAYTTFGGDEHAGQIALNAHKPKSTQLEHMHQLMRGELEGAAPVESFYWVLRNKASAELQPMKEGVVVQHDEDALGRTFVQTQVISSAMLNAIDHQDGRNKSPIEIFNICLEHASFETDSLEDIHDKVLLSYINWKFAQHKIHAFPINMTYGRNVDHQTSRRTPNIGAFHAPELAQLSIDCIDRIAKTNKVLFTELTHGYTKEACLQRAHLDSKFADSLLSAMWTASATDGRKRKITTLYQKIASGEFNMGVAFQDSNSWVTRLFDSIATWGATPTISEASECSTQESMEKKRVSRLSLFSDALEVDVTQPAGYKKQP